MNYQDMWMDLKNQLLQKKDQETIMLMNEIEHEAYEDAEIQRKKDAKGPDTAFMDVIRANRRKMAALSN